MLDFEKKSQLSWHSEISVSYFPFLTWHVGVTGINNVFIAIGVRQSVSPQGVVVCLSQANYRRPGSLRVLHSDLGVPRIVFFLTQTSDVVPGVCWNHPPGLCVTAPSAPTPLAPLLPLLPTFFVAPLSALGVFFELLVFLLPDVSDPQDCYIYHYCFLL